MSVTVSTSGCGSVSNGRGLQVHVTPGGNNELTNTHAWFMEQRGSEKSTNFQTRDRALPTHNVSWQQLAPGVSR